MRLLGAVRERAKWIDAEAAALIGTHGRDAYEQARQRERDANSLGAALFWRAVKKVVLSRPAASGVEVLPPVRSNSCIACLVEQIAGARASDAAPLPVACLACARRRLGLAPARDKITKEMDGLPPQSRRSTSASIP